MDDKNLEFYVYARECALKAYRGNAQNLVLPATHRGRPITKISQGAFKGNSSLKCLVIPESVVEIEAGAFENCTALEAVTNSNEGYDYHDLESADEERLNTILAGEFRSCLSVSEIGNRAFKGATAIHAFEMSAKELKVGAEAFSSSGIEVFLAVAAETVTFGPGCFSHCPRLIMCHLLNARLTGLPQNAFWGCGSLKDFRCQRLSGNIASGAFRDCTSLTFVGEMSRVAIGEHAFDNCPKLSLATKKQERKPPSPKKPKEQTVTKQDVEDIQTLVQRELKKRAAKMAEDVTVKDFGFPLFFSKETFTEAPPATIVKGIFEEVEANGEFQFMEENLRFPPFCCQKSHLDPLLRFFCDYSSTVALRLEHRDDGAYVCTGIRHVEQPVKRDESISEDLLDVIIARLFHKSAADLPLLSKENDLALFYRICKNSIPPKIQKAIEKEKETMDLHPMRGSDEAKHAHTAWKMLLNVDFIPPPSDWSQLPSLAECKASLDRDFYGLDEVKQHLLGVIAEIKRTSKMPRYGLLLIGPAGTGKSALARAFADVISKPFVQVDCSTIGADRDASIGERLWGTERIYNNARYGMIFQKMIEHRSSSYVLHLAEVDIFPEVADGLRSLLDRLGTAHEAFLEQFLPTEGIFCIASCNSTKNIPQPLLDRFHVIELGSYTRDEKKQILQINLPKVREERSLPNMFLSDEAVEYLSGILTDPGARDVEKAVATIASDYIVRCADTSDPNPVKIYDVQDIQKLFPQAHKVSLVEKPGQAQFVYDTGLFGVVQAIAVPGTGQIRVLGQMDNAQYGHCVAAVEAARCVASILRRMDVTLMTSTPIATGKTGENEIGLAAYMAVLSYLTGTILAKACFCGGVDLTGNVYRTNTIGPLLNAVSRSDKVLYAPYGAEEPLKGNGMICQSPYARVLFEMAASQSKKTRGAS